MRLLAIDPATNKTGLAIFEDGKLIKTLTVESLAKTPLERRLDMIWQIVPAISNADVIVSEEPFLQGKANTGMQRMLGMIEKLTSGKVNFIHPMTLKKRLGTGNLDKVGVAFAAVELLKTEEEQEILAHALSREAFDETDAIAIGLSHLKGEG